MMKNIPRDHYRGEGGKPWHVRSRFLFLLRKAAEMLLSATPQEERRGWGVNFSSFATCYANILHAEKKKKKERGAASHFLLLLLPLFPAGSQGAAHMDMEIGAAAVLKMANDGRSRQAQKSWAEQGKGKKWEMG